MFCPVKLFLQFWDTRTPNPMMTIQLPERCYCADVVSIQKTNLGCGLSHTQPDFDSNSEQHTKFSMNSSESYVTFVFAFTCVNIV